MKSFEDICRMTKEEVKAYMESFLKSIGKEPINQDGFLYYKGHDPILLVAHMDTVHKEQCKDIVYDGGKMSSPQGIGGDDRCGVFIIQSILNDGHDCSVLLCEDEEIGCVGARKFCKTEFINKLDVNFMVEADRRGSKDLVYYSCANDKFEEFVSKATGYKKAQGSCSDISYLMKSSKIAAVNISSGYYHEHHIEEYVMYDEMIETIGAIESLIIQSCDKPFEYIEKEIEWPSYYTKYYGKHNYGSSVNGYGTNTNSRYDDDWWFGDSAFYYGNQSKNPMYSGNFQSQYEIDETKNEGNEEDEEDEEEVSEDDVEKELMLELEVVYDKPDPYDPCAIDEYTCYIHGKTKEECWAKFFLMHKDVCMNEIAGHSWE